MIATDNYDVRVLTSACADFAASGTTVTWDTGRAAAGLSFRDSNGADAGERRISNVATFTITNQTFADATKYLTGPFTNYHWNHMDYVVLTGGTAVVAGPYQVVAKIDNSTIQLASSVAGGGSPTDVVGTLYQGTDFRECFVPARTFDEAGLIQCDVWGTVTGSSANIVVTGCTYGEASSSTITKGSGGFAGYTFAVGDYVLVTAGTGARLGLYQIGSKDSDDVISIMGTLGKAANTQTDIAVTIIKASSFRATLWVAYQDGSAPAKIDLAPNNWTIQYFPSAIGTGHFTMRIRIMLSRGQELSTNAILDYEAAVVTSVTLNTSTWTQRHQSRSTVDFKRDCTIYFTYAKGATTGNVGINPKGVMWTHWAPKVVGS